MEYFVESSLLVWLVLLLVVVVVVVTDLLLDCCCHCSVKSSALFALKGKRGRQTVQWAVGGSLLQLSREWQDKK